jgi:hypothetical protein
MESGVRDLGDLPPLHYSNTWFLPIIIIIVVIIMTFTLMSSLVIVQRNPNVPSTLAIWKKKDIMEWSIGRMGLRNAQKWSTNSMQNNVTGVVSICTVARNDGSNLINDRSIIAPLILLDVNMDS